MNRKRDLDNLGLIYESAYLADTEFNNLTDIQRSVVLKLEQMGYHVNKIRTIADPVEGTIHMSKNAPATREEGDMTIKIDPEGLIDGQPHESFIADIEENEETNDLGQQERAAAIDANPIDNYEDAEDLGPNQETEEWGDEAMTDEEPGLTSTRFDQDENELEKAKKKYDDINREYWANRGDDSNNRDLEAADLSSAREEAREYYKSLQKQKNESFNSRGDRDMSLLAEKYLNISKS